MKFDQLSLGGQWVPRLVLRFRLILTFCMHFVSYQPWSKFNKFLDLCLHKALALCKDACRKSAKPNVLGFPCPSFCQWVPRNHRLSGLSNGLVVWTFEVNLAQAQITRKLCKTADTVCLLLFHCHFVEIVKSYLKSTLWCDSPCGSDPL